MYDQEINELLDIEKKVLKIYDKLIINRLNNNTKEFNKEIDNLALIIEYEDKLITEFASKNKSKVDFFIEYNQIDFDPFTEEIIDTQKLYNNRLAISFVNKKSKSLISNDIYEIYAKYIWNINDEKNEENKEKITKIQFYMCYIYNTLEGFFLDNMYSFDRKYGNIHFFDINTYDFTHRICRNSIIDMQINYGLDKFDKLWKTKANTSDYLYYKTFLKSVVQAIDKEDYKSYMEELQKQSLKKRLLLNRALGG